MRTNGPDGQSEQSDEPKKTEVNTDPHGVIGNPHFDESLVIQKGLRELGLIE